MNNRNEDAFRDLAAKHTLNQTLGNDNPTSNWADWEGLINGKRVAIEIENSSRGMTWHLAKYLTERNDQTEIIVIIETPLHVHKHKKDARIAKQLAPLLGIPCHFFQLSATNSIEDIARHLQATL